MLKQRLQDEVKAAMLAKDTVRLDTLRGLKSVILYAEVASGKREAGLDESEIESLFAKEAKKRAESASLYVQGGAQDRADKELIEKAIIEEFLPQQLTEEELGSTIDEIIAAIKPEGLAQMGQVIGAVKARVGSSADGALVARLVKQKLEQ